MTPTTTNGREMTEAITREALDETQPEVGGVETLLLHIVGTAPLLMSNGLMADPSYHYARESKARTSIRGSARTEAVEAEIQYLGWRGRLYYDEAIGVHIPGTNIEACLIKAARSTKNGKDLERGMFVPVDKVKLQHNGPTNVADLYEDKNFVSSLIVKQGQARLPRLRPKFNEWSLTTEIVLWTDQVDRPALERIADSAGRLVGLGDYRPRYGRFVATLSDVES